MRTALLLLVMVVLVNQLPQVAGAFKVRFSQQTVFGDLNVIDPAGDEPQPALPADFQIPRLERPGQPAVSFESCLPVEACAPAYSIRAPPPLSS